MTAAVIETLADPSTWKALAPDGVTPSTEVVLSKDTSRAPPGGASSVRVVAGAAALHHSIQCDLGPVDLSKYEELRVLVRSDRAADGSTAAPFFLEMRLGSAALPPGDPANTWKRMTPTSGSRGWELVRLSLSDLDSSVRSALTRVQIRCAAAVPFAVNLASLIAVHDEMLGDVDGALAALLHERIEISGTLVPAVLHPARGKITATRPYFEILNFDVCFSAERTTSARAPGDFTGDDYRLRPRSFAYELYYQITAVADDRASQTQMLELALRTLRPLGELFVNGYPLPMEMIAIPPRERIGGARTDEIPLYFKILAQQEVGLPEPVRPARTVLVDGDLTFRT
ncbi:hypothetical protein [Sorangium sp. So ce1000]|uniref:hypothetical protein n=1 Tax=Sorangium sp. So ce1000 TaxID=3133325 RepID=UPI003F5EA2C8